MLRARPKGPSRFALLAAGLLLSFPAPARAHDVASDVVVHAFLKPEDRHLRLLVRAPLGALRDVAFPKRGPGYLDLSQAEPALLQAVRLWIADPLEVFEEGVRLSAPRILAARASLPSDRSFESYGEALAQIEGAPLPTDTDLYWNQALVDTLLEYDIRSDRSRFSIRPGFERLGLRVSTVLRFLPPGGAVRAFDLAGDPGVVRLDPRWHQAALSFVHLGFLHILEGTDHLLFLLCLVIPLRRLRPLVLVVTAFTVAHSITLLAAALGLLPRAPWFPSLVETLIAASIVYMALENVVSSRPERRAAIAFGFGLVHGFGFSFALEQTLQFAGSHLLTSLLSFNLGVELGQLLVLAALVPALGLVSRAGAAERPLQILLSALVAHTGWHWLLERFDRLREFPLPKPEWTTAGLASATRWALLATIAGAAAWLLFSLLRPPAPPREAGTTVEETR